jgi:hypothetical protein
MIIQIMRSLEDWRNSSEVQRVIDAAEKESGFSADSYDVYNDFIDCFRFNVVHRLHGERCTIVWHHQQSRGVGCIFQGHSAECEAVFDAAMEAYKDVLFADCVAFGKAELATRQSQ